MFEVVAGVEIEDLTGLENGYEECGNGAIAAVLSAPLLESFIAGFVELIEEPVFFFLELPLTKDEEKELKNSGKGHAENYKLYYLDNCTHEVADAIMKTYGSLLINDGVCRFGFGGNVSGDEIYVQTYKVLSLYCSNDSVYQKALALLKSVGAKRQQSLVTPWEIISAQNPGVCMPTEEDGITAFDLPDLLKSAGMYEDNA